ncbi:MAG: ribosomal protein L13e [Candidatus Bathyarchaeia archaeon]
MSAVKPLVFKKGGKQRSGKGFSLNELKEAKLSVKEALKLGIPVDLRRRTIHKGNVESLINFLRNKKGSQSLKIKEGEKLKAAKSN